MEHKDELCGFRAAARLYLARSSLKFSMKRSPCNGSSGEAIALVTSTGR